MKISNFLLKAMFLLFESIHVIQRFVSVLLYRQLTWLDNTSLANNQCSIDSLRCYQCNSMHDQNCLTANLQPKECVGDAKFCVKSVGFLDKGTLVIRMCSGEHQIMNSCRPQTMEDGIVANVCFHTCNNDACNSSFNLTPLKLLIVSSVFLTMCLRLVDVFS